jgi:hypothetical protein
MGAMGISLIEATLVPAVGNAGVNEPPGRFIPVARKAGSYNGEGLP